MTLEDHAGDIVNKARLAAGISSKIAAQALGLTAPEFAEFESAGSARKKLDFEDLSKLIGLDGCKLATIANGWTPAPVDLSKWRELRQITTMQGGNAVNSYLVWDATTREAALFDTGWEAGPILDIVAEAQLRLSYICITHGHHDHIAALEKIRRQFPNVQAQPGAGKYATAHRNQAGGGIQLGGLRIATRETPGHSPDSLTYVISGFVGNAPLVAVVGDALFAGSLGRGFQSANLLRQNVKEHILSLPPSTLLCPGHGPLTTVAEEIASNPFFG